MDATSCFARHVQSRDRLAALVHALGIGIALQTAHAVVDHRGDDGNVKRLGGNLSESWANGPQLHSTQLTPL